MILNKVEKGVVVLSTPFFILEVRLKVSKLVTKLEARDSKLVAG
jgi:hypothetical protein